MMFPAIHGVAGAAGGAPYAAKAADFDGTNDYLTKSGALTGAAASKLFSGSLWFKRSVASTNQTIWGAVSTADVIRFNASNDFAIQVEAAGGGPGLGIAAFGQSDTTAWHNAVWSVDMADTGKRHLYIDGVSALDDISDYEDTTLDFTDASNTIGARNDATRKLDACIADLWLAPAQYIDLSVAANRLKFYNAGSPVDLGSDGSTPTGVAPLMFFSGPVATWHTNKGSGGGFTENGALTACASDPT